MNFTFEKKVIFALSLAFLAMSLLYFQSLSTIKNMYTESALKSLESGFASSTFIMSNVTEPIVPPEEPILTNPPVPSPIVTPTPVVPDTACYTGGCSGQICGDASVKDMATTCEWREEYTCYQNLEVTSCQRQTNGQCAWTETAALKRCLIDAGTAQEKGEPTDLVI